MMKNFKIGSVSHLNHCNIYGCKRLATHEIHSNPEAPMGNIIQLCDDHFTELRDLILIAPFQAKIKQQKEYIKELRNIFWESGIGSQL
jgi:hypothetical protein